MKARIAATGFLIAAIAVAGVFLVSTRTDGLDGVRESGVIRIGYAVEPPYAFIGSDGLVTGESPELARLVALALGIPRIEWVLTTFDALIPDLREGRFDLVAAGMFVTPERAALVAFADPSLAVRAGLLVPRGNSLALHSYEELIAHPAARVAVLSGSVEKQRLRARGLPESRLLVVPDAITGCRAVESGAAHALALSLPSTRHMARQFPGLEAVAVPGRASPEGAEEPFEVAVAIARGRPNLLEAWNEAQTRVIGSPAHLRAIAPFGFEGADLPVPQVRLAAR